MPYPAQISEARVIEGALTFVEREGVEALSLHKLAAELGVKAPSLYRYVSSKADLLRAINRVTAARLADHLNAARAALPNADDPRAVLLALATAYRAFVNDNAPAYGLLFHPGLLSVRPEDVLLAAIALPMQTTMQAWTGETHALAALRGLWALLHGFSTMEAGGQFQRGGDLDAAFAFAVGAYLEGCQRAT